METEHIPILELVKKGGFEAWVITTYNAYFPFYEDVVLRHMVSSGCRHNVLLMDPGCLSQTLQEHQSRPRLAGHAYTLIPVPARGAFHPKVVLLLAKKKGLLFVGDHNMTLSGWGLNKEMTNCVSFADTNVEGVSLASQVWAFLKNWVKHAAGVLPPQLVESFYSVKPAAP